VLVIVMMIGVLLLIALAAALPSVYQEGMREREEETIFRGYQYGRAVAMFHKQFNRYPVSVKELLQTNGMRFLRKEYTDPLDPKGKWRFIHVNAAGVLLDSKNQPLNNPNNPNNPAGLGQNNPGTSGSSFGGFGQTGSQQGIGGFGMTSSPTGPGQSSFGPTSSFFGSGDQIQGAFIMGVAPTSHHESIKEWQKHHHYDEWEFLGIDKGIFGVQIGAQVSSPAPGGFGSQPTSQGPGSPQGSFGPTSTPQSFGPSTN
jgi:type II secretory pathway pseudopilin PulG